MASNEIGFTLVINGTERVVKNIEEVQQAMVDLKGELKTTDLGTEAFDNVRNQLDKAGSAFKEFKNDTKPTEVKDQFASLGRGIGESFSIAEDGMKSFGVESEAVSKIASGSSDLITIALRAHELAELRVTAATAIRSVTEKAAAAGTWLATAAQNAFNISLTANPIGLVVVAIAALVAGIYLLIKPIMQAVDAFENMSTGMKVVLAIFAPIIVVIYGIKKALEALGLIDDAETKKARANAAARLKSIDDENSAYNRKKKSQERAMALAEAEGASAKELLQMKKKLIWEEVAAKQKAVAALMKLGQDMSDDDRKRLRALKEEIKDLANQSKIEQAKYDKDKKKESDDKRKKEQEAADEAAQTARDRANDAHQKRMDDLKKQKDDAIAIETDALKKTKELNDDAYLNSIDNEQFKAKETLRIQQEAARAELQIQIDKLANKKNLTKEEQAALMALNGEMLALTKKQGEDTINLQKQQAKEQLDYKRLAEDLETQLIYDKNKRELETLKHQYQRLSEDVEANEKLSAAQKTELILKYAQIYADQKAALQKKQAQDDLKTRIEQLKAEAADTESSFESRRSFLLEANAKLLEDYTLNGEERLKLEKEISDKIKALDEEERQSKLKTASDAIKLTEDTAKAISSVGDAVFAQRLSKVEKGSAAEAKIMKDQFEFNKKMQYGSAIIDGAKAAVASLSQSPVAIGPVPNPVGIASLALVAITTAATLAKIASTKFEGGGGGGGGGGKGNKLASGGMISGPGTGTSDSIPARLSNGESVINARSTQMYGGLLSAINVAGGGVAFAEGGIASSTIAGMNYQPPVIKTYVVASDMTSQQEADAKIARLAQL
jgi:hypothetical protein